MPKYIKSTAKAPTGIFSTNGHQKQDGPGKHNRELLAYSKGADVKNSSITQSQPAKTTHQTPPRGQPEN